VKLCVIGEKGSENHRKKGQSNSLLHVIQFVNLGGFRFNFSLRLLFWGSDFFFFFSFDYGCGLLLCGAGKL
jgi:hypothetical protein